MKVDALTMEELTALTEALLDDDGKEILNPMPLEVKEDLGRPPTLKEQICRILKGERMKALLEQQGYESFEEADDFDVPDEPEEPISGYEVKDMIPERPVDPVARREYLEKELEKLNETKSGDSSRDSKGSVPSSETDTSESGGE